MSARRSATATAGLVVCALTLGLLAAGVWLSLTAPPEAARLYEASTGDLVAPFAFTMFTLVAAAVIIRRPDHRIGPLLAVFPFVMALAAVSSAYAVHAYLAGGGSLAAVAAWLGAWTWLPGITTLALVITLFPDGTLPSRRWRWLLEVQVGSYLAEVVLGVALWPQRGPALIDAGDSWSGMAGFIGSVALALSFVGFIGALASLVARFRRATTLVRQQLKWLLVGVGLLVMALVLAAVSDLLISVEQRWMDVFGITGLLGVPVSIGLAILRYRLYDIDRLISRTLSYALLSAILAAVYAGGVIGARALLAPLTVDAQWAVAASTLVVAAAFGPLRRRVQDGVDRRFNRARYDATLTVQQFSARLRDEMDLDALAGQLQTAAASTVEPAHVSLWLRSPRQVR